MLQKDSASSTAVLVVVMAPMVVVASKVTPTPKRTEAALGVEPVAVMKSVLAMELVVQVTLVEMTQSGCK